MPQSANKAREMPLCNKPQSLDAQNLWLRNKFPLRSVSNVVRDNHLRRRAALKHHPAEPTGSFLFVPGLLYHQLDGLGTCGGARRGGHGKGVGSGGGFSGGWLAFAGGTGGL